MVQIQAATIMTAHEKTRGLKKLKTKLGLDLTLGDMNKPCGFRTERHRAPALGTST